MGDSFDQSVAVSDRKGVLLAPLEQRSLFLLHLAFLVVDKLQVLVSEVGRQVFQNPFVLH